MKICIDAREVTGVRTGLGRYALNLVRSLAAIDRHNQYVLLKRSCHPDPLVTQENFSEIPLSYGIITPQNMLQGGAVINSVQADVYHSLHQFVPLGARAGHIVITLHDLIWVENSEVSYDSWWRRRLSKLAFGALMSRAVARAEEIIAISAHTRQTALNHYGFPEEKCSVIHHGVDTTFLDGSSISTLPAACRGRRLILSVGNTKPYKNIPRLLQAFKTLLPDHPDLLLLISSRGDGYPSLERLSGRLRISNHVLFPQQLSDAQIRSCFSNAICLAFPSIVEGFGFPVIEAMAGGCPVLASNTSSLPEVAGEAAVLVDPLSTQAIAQGLRRLVEDPFLRQKLILKGRRQARRFSWNVCARKTLAVYHRLMRRGRAPAGAVTAAASAKM